MNILLVYKDTNAIMKTLNHHSIKIYMGKRRHLVPEKGISASGIECVSELVVNDGYACSKAPEEVFIQDEKP